MEVGSVLVSNTDKKRGTPVMNTMDDTVESELLEVPILLERPWAVYAACRSEQSLLFFPQNKNEERKALAICGSCPVVEDCLAHAFETKERFGVWGGMTERQRRKHMIR